MMESENNREFDRRIKAKVDNFQPEVPATLWNAIMRELPQEDKVRSMAGKRRFPYSWAAIAACLLIATSFWKLQPDEVIYLRSTTAIAEKAAESDADSSDTLAEPAPAVSSVPPVSYAASSKVAAGAGMNSYAASQRTDRESRQARVEPGRQITPVETPLPEPATDPEVQNVLEEEVAFAPAPIEEAIVADLPDVSHLLDVSHLPESDQNALSSEDRSRPKVVSSVLNFIASNIQIGSGGTRVEFSETEHGVLKVDIKGFFNKNNQGL